MPACCPHTLRVAHDFARGRASRLNSQRAHAEARGRVCASAAYHDAKVCYGPGADGGPAVARQGGAVGSGEGLQPVVALMCREYAEISAESRMFTTTRNQASGAGSNLYFSMNGRKPLRGKGRSLKNEQQHG